MNTPSLTLLSLLSLCPTCLPSSLCESKIHKLRPGAAAEQWWIRKVTVADRRVHLFQRIPHAWYWVTHSLLWGNGDDDGQGKGVNCLLRELTHSYHVSLLQTPETHLAPTPNAPNGLHVISTNQHNTCQETNKGCVCQCKANSPLISRSVGSSSTCSHKHKHTWCKHRHRHTDRLESALKKAKRHEHMCLRTTVRS